MYFQCNLSIIKLVGVKLKKQFMKIISTLLIIVICIGCKQTSKEIISGNRSFIISGTINGDYSDFIYLNYGEIKDSVEIINNSFKFEGIVERPTQGWLNLKPDANVAWLYIENSDIKIKADYENGFQNEKPLNVLIIKEIEGSYSAEIQKEYREFYQANQNKENFKSLLYDKLEVFIDKNSTHPFSGTVLGELALINPVLSKQELIQLYAKMDTTQQNKDDLEMFKMGIATRDLYGVGKPFLKFKLPNIKDEEVHVSTFFGKTTLIDFWASWCKPCREKHPDLIKLKKRFEKDNFEIVGISIDDKKENWLKAVDMDNLEWTNLLDINKEVSSELGIQAIPFNYLIDEEGIILGVNLSIEQVEKIISGKALR